MSFAMHGNNGDETMTKEKQTRSSYMVSQNFYTLSSIFDVSSKLTQV